MPAVALVTGGNRGIGLGITRRLLADGFAVSILATREEPAEVLAELRGLAGTDDRVRYVRGSVADPADHDRYVQDAIDAWGRLDVLVNNAGVGPTVRDDILDAGTESFDRVLGINLRGPYFLTQAFARAAIDLRGTAGRPARATGRDDRQRLVHLGRQPSRPTAATTASPRPASRWRHSSGPRASRPRGSSSTRSAREWSRPT